MSSPGFCSELVHYAQSPLIVYFWISPNLTLAMNTKLVGNRRWRCWNLCFLLFQRWDDETSISQIISQGSLTCKSWLLARKTMLHSVGNNDFPNTNIKYFTLSFVWPKHYIFLTFNLIRMIPFYLFFSVNVVWLRWFFLCTAVLPPGKRWLSQLP